MMEILHAPCENSKEKCPLPQSSGKMPGCHCHHGAAVWPLVPGEREKEKHLCSLNPYKLPFPLFRLGKKKVLNGALDLHLECSCGFQVSFEPRPGHNGTGKMVNSPQI